MNKYLVFAIVSALAVGLYIIYWRITKLIRYGSRKHNHGNGQHVNADGSNGQYDHGNGNGQFYRCKQ